MSLSEDLRRCLMTRLTEDFPGAEVSMYESHGIPHIVVNHVHQDAASVRGTMEALLSSWGALRRNDEDRMGEGSLAMMLRLEGEEDICPVTVEYFGHLQQVHIGIDRTLPRMT